MFHFRDYFPISTNDGSRFQEICNFLKEEESKKKLWAGETCFVGAISDQQKASFQILGYKILDIGNNTCLYL